jgi:serine/arginine repetitive matrix protein 2
MQLGERETVQNGRASRASNMSTASRGLRELGEREMNTNGRASRASDMSRASRGSKGLEPMSSADLPGVASMLRNSTEMGNLGGLTMPDSMGVPNNPRGSRRGATSVLSMASTYSNHSHRTSMHRGRRSQTSNATRYSRENNVPQYVADSVSPTTMDIPGSSPLFPLRARNPHDSHRSRSMTTINASKPARASLSTNRSVVSLHSTEYNQRSGSPYRNSSRPQRPGLRPTSPAFADSAGAYAQRGLSNGTQSLPHHPGATRLGMPSDTSFRRDERRDLNAGLPTRSRTPVYPRDLYTDIPPVPPLVFNRSHAFGRTPNSQRSYRSASHRSGKASISSHSTSRRTDSDIPSSDATLPPTPKDGLSANGSGKSGTQLHKRNISGRTKDQVSSCPEYYDYTEHFEDEQEAGSGLPVACDVILEERGTPEPVSKQVDVKELPESVTTVRLDIAELPASPVPQPLTKTLVHRVTRCGTPTEAIESCGPSTEANSCHETSSFGIAAVDQPNDMHTTSPTRPPKVTNNEHSIYSQVEPSVIDSSTIEFAVRCSTMVVDNGVTMTTNGRCETTRPELEPTTEDGMSDLLDGYQHTDTKPEIGPGDEEVAVANEDAEYGSNYVANSTDGQSFKSCTDVPKFVEHSVERAAIKSTEPCEDLNLDVPVKDLNVKSSLTYKDVITPQRACFLPDLRSSLPQLPTSESKFERSARAPVLSPHSLDDKLPPPSASESSMSRLSSKFRPLKLSSKHSSGKASISSATGPPRISPVPPRGSSSSKEAQRSKAVIEYVLGRFSKANTSSLRGSGKKEAQQAVEDSSRDVPTPPPMRDRPISSNGIGFVGDPFKPDEQPEYLLMRSERRILKKQELVTSPDGSLTPKEHPAGGLPMLRFTAPFAGMRPSGTPVSVLANSMAIYSPVDISHACSSFSTSCLQPSHGANLQVLESSRHESQAITHSSLREHRSLAPDSLECEGKSLTQGTGLDEMTTTDLRPTIHDKHSSNHLCDLQEESHEDSSLNTSANNLKDSKSRDCRVDRVSLDKAAMFGQKGRLSVASQSDSQVDRSLTDEAVMFRGSLSTKMCHQSGLVQARGLPSLNFSRTNLMDQFGEMFEYRGSRSLELSPEKRAEFLQSELYRSASAGGPREKYRSSRLDLDTSQELASTAAELFSERRSLSPQAFKEEVDKLSVPSIKSLTARLSEAVASLKEDYQDDAMPEDTEKFPEEEEILETALEELKGVSGPAPKRSQARLRAVRGSSTVKVVSDASVEAQQQDTRDDPRSRPAKQLCELGTTRGRSWSIVHTTARDKTLSELEAHSVTVARPRSLSLGQQDLYTSSGSRLSSRSVPSLDNTETTTDTRPWNNTDNYPWAVTDSLRIDIPLPQFVAAKHSPRPGQSNLRHRLSEASLASGTLSLDGTPVSPTTATGTMPMPGSDDPYTHARRQSHRWSLFGTSKQAVNPPTGIDASGYATGPVRVRDEDQSHGAGDRYPTSALPLPSNLHIITGSVSHFSQYSTDEDAPSSSRAGRLQKKKQGNKKPASKRAQPSRSHEVPQATSTNETTNSSEQVTSQAQAQQNRRTFSGAEGMSRWAYFSAKFTDKVKSLYDRVLHLGRRNRKSKDGGAQQTLTPQ